MAEEACEYHRLIRLHDVEAEALRIRYVRLIEEMRATCPHSELTEWVQCGMLDWEKSCKRCMKVIRTNHDTR